MKLKHKIPLLVIGILLVVSLLISSSYALWVFNVSQESTNVLVSDCFEISLSDGNRLKPHLPISKTDSDIEQIIPYEFNNGDNYSIRLYSSFPMRDSDGVKTNPYTFTIRNICNHPVDFQINLETLNTSTIDESFIKADLNGYITEYNAAESIEPTIDNAKSAVMLYEDTLAVNSSKTYNLRIWVNETATQEDVENKTYASKVSVRATVRKEFEEGTLISGQNFNKELKKLADGGNPKYYTANESITAIEWSVNEPQESDNAVNIAANGTSTPIYAWFRNGTIYINSRLDKIYMNPSSSYMFYNMENIERIDLSNFDTSKVYNMSYMFCRMINLTSINLSNFDTSNVTNMSYMFSDMWKITSLDLSYFNTSKVTNMSSMFCNMVGLTSIDLSHFDTSQVTDVSNIFYDLWNLTSLDISNFDTSNVTDMSGMFYDMNSLTSIDLSTLDTSKVTNMSGMLHGMRNLTSIDLSAIDTSDVTDISGMFSDMNSLTSIDLSPLDTSNVTNMRGIFSGMSSLTSIDLSSLDTSNVTNMSGMFAQMSSLTSIDLSPLDTSNVTEMSGLFYGMSSLTEIDLSPLDTSNVTDMSGMFAQMTNLTGIDLSPLDTSKVINISGMFDQLDNVEVLDLSMLDLSNVEVVNGEYTISYDTWGTVSTLFKSRSLKTIIVSNSFDLPKIDKTENLFLDCNSLVGGSGTTYDSNHINAEYARVDDPANGKPGYFTLKTN